jgi:hypothetical protein
LYSFNLSISATNTSVRNEMVGCGSSSSDMIKGWTTHI